MQNLEFVNLKCVTYTQPIWVPLSWLAILLQVVRPDVEEGKERRGQGAQHGTTRSTAYRPNRNAHFKKI